MMIPIKWNQAAIKQLERIPDYIKQDYELIP